MSAVASPALPPAAINAKLIAFITAAAVSLGVFLSGFVLDEPAPYELFMAPLIAVWALFGLRISKPVMPLLILLVTFNIGGMIAMTQMSDLMETPLYLAVSLFLAFTAVFYAAVTEAQPALFPLIFRAWLAAAILTSILGIAGYFNAFPGAEVFTLYGRAAGAFQDPNVFGPFLVLPGIFMLHRLMTGSIARMPLYAVPLLIVAGRHLLLILARRLGPVCGLGDPADRRTVPAERQRPVQAARRRHEHRRRRAAHRRRRDPVADTRRRRAVQQPRPARPGL